MAFRYANQDDVFRELEIDDADMALVGQLERMEAALSMAFDNKIGRSFGDEPVASTRVIERGCGRDGVVVLQRPARAIESVSAGGRWDGSTWDGDEPVENWYPVFDREGLIYGIATNGNVTGSVRVTAIWASDPVANVPDDVAHCLTWLTIRQYRRLTASPNELVGPEGFTVPTPHAWDDPMVKEIIAKYRVVEVIV